MAEDVAEFRRRLAEAIAWCAGRASIADPAHSLRTPSLRPEGMWEEEVKADASERALRRAERARVLADARAELLRLKTRPRCASAEPLVGGHLLVYYPDASLSEGWSGEQSRGFFDVDDAPPWDAWIWYVRERGSLGDQSYDAYLLSWVPPAMIELAQQGIWANSTDCLVWAEDAAEPFIEQLRAAGLLN